MTRVLLGLLLALAFLSAAKADTAGEERLLTLRQVMTERLALMAGVAQHKWNEGLAVEDLEREAEVLAQTVERAAAEGLDPALAARVVAAQIAAAKAIQRSLFADWQEAEVPPLFEAPSLTETLRPEIGRLTSELIAALKAAETLLGDCAARQALSPLPRALAGHPDAWGIAVQGVLGDGAWCP